MSSTANAPMLDQAGGLLFIHALTPLHPGSGTALGTVDLPVQRERHTQWPVIAASSLKGILRDAVRRRVGNTPDLFAAFGPETAEADKHAGALSFTDGRILAFPVRSLRGVFAWVSSPAVLARLARDLSLLPDQSQITKLQLPETWPAKNQALVVPNSPLLIDTNKLVLEEFEFLCRDGAQNVAEWVGERAVADKATRQRLKTCLVILHDDDFTHFVRHATEISARIGLDYERKTVRTGALFYQEFLPAETIFYSVILAHASRRDDQRKSAQDLMAYIKQHKPPILQIGGDETIGKGLCAVTLLC